MDDLVGLFARTFVIGLVVAAPVGAMGVLCIQRTLASGWRAGVATGLGIATADALFAAVAAFGLSGVSQWLVATQAPLRIGGGLVLLWLGFRAFVTVPDADDASGGASTGNRHFMSAVGLTLTNPMTIIAFASIFAGAGLVVQPGATSALVATLGVALGSLAWWLLLASTVFAIRHAVSHRILTLINRVSGAVLAVFGIVALIAGIAAIGT